MAGEAWVAVPVTGLWRSPESPRAVDEPMVRASPDHAAWLAAMDAHEIGDPHGRSGLLDRLDSQLTWADPVEVHAVVDGWSQVSCPLQPAGPDGAGYRGWVLSAHLRQHRPAQVTTAGDGPLDRYQFVDRARRHLGLRYLWGGLSPAGLDCSGLVHHSARELGVLVPRDAHDQHSFAAQVPAGAERIGDLYFFAQPGKAVHHVGIVTSPGVMLHAPESGATVVEEDLSADRLRTLVGTGRITS